MKILLKCILVCFIGTLGGLYFIGSQQQTSKTNSAINNNNYNGLYNISYSDISSLCGELGYQFKLIHQRDGYSSTDSMRKSNCFKPTDNSLEGYIYSSKAPNLRVFWISKNGKLSYKS